MGNEAPENKSTPKESYNLYKMRFYDFNIVYAAYLSYILAVTIAAPTQGEQNSCQESELVVNLSNNTTSIKIVTGIRDTLFSVDSTNTKFEDINRFVNYIIELFYREEGKILQHNKTPLSVIKSPLDNGVELSLVDERSSTLFKKLMVGSNERLMKTDVKCAVISRLTGVFEPSLDANHRDAYNKTALSWAIFLGQYDMVKSLVEKRPQVNLVGPDGAGPMVIAILSGQAVVVEYLIAHGVNADEQIEGTIRPLHLAALLGRLECTKILLKYGASVDAPLPFSRATPLHHTAVFGSTKVAKELVSKGADINAMTSDGHTPLHTAVRTGSVELIEFLVKAGADLNIRDKRGLTPLATAIRYNSDEDSVIKIVKLMVEDHSPDLSVKDNAGRTPMAFAGLKRFSKVQFYLRAHGAQQ